MSTASPPAPASPRSTVSAPPRSQRSRPSARQRRAPRSRRLGSSGRSFNAATASRARSCPLRRCSRATRIRRIPISTTRCPATSAAVGPTCAFVKRSSRPRNRADREAEMILDHLASLAAGADPSPSANGLSRRKFLQAGAAAGGGLVLSLSLPFANGVGKAAGADGFAPNAFIRIGGDGQIVLTMPYVEMGQGTYTSIPMLIAEELEVDLSQVRLDHAPPNEKLYGNPLLAGVQATGNSNAIRAAWQPLRQAGATARTMLVSAAAKRWNVDPASCRAQSGEVLHPPTGRRAKYGELAADAARMPVPESVALKRPEDFKLIGTPAKRLDTPAKVNGTAVYGIDVRPPGVKIATLAQSPVFGGRVKSVDDKAAKAVKGVRQIVRLDDAVAVVADHMGAARKGLEALIIKWDDGAYATLSTNDILHELEKATLSSGAVANNTGDVTKALE